MDFEAVLEKLASFFEAGRHWYAVIGGVGLASYGMPRTTLDLDLLADAETQDEVIRFLESIGYETLYRSPGYSNHQHERPDWGGVDLVYVRDETSRRVFEGLRFVEGPGKRLIPVPRPEHLIAMKVAAMKNDPSRIYRDMADIEFLLRLPNVDREEVRAQFEKHGLLERYLELDTF